MARLIWREPRGTQELRVALVGLAAGIPGARDPTGCGSNSLGVVDVRFGLTGTPSRYYLRYKWGARQLVLWADLGGDVPEEVRKFISSRFPSTEYHMRAVVLGVCFHYWDGVKETDLGEGTIMGLSATPAHG